MTPASSEDPLEHEDQKNLWINTELLQNALGHESKVLRFDVEPATAKGDNLMGVLHRVHVQYHVSTADVFLEKSIIIKSLPKGELLQNFAHENGIFEREACAYEGLQKMYDFADSRLKDHHFHRFSTESFPSSRPDTLILGDLKPLGFLMVSRRDRFDFPHAKLVVKNLARLHVLSITYSEENPDFFTQFRDKIYSEDNRTRLFQFFDPMFKSISKEIKKWIGFSEIASKIENKSCDFLDNLIGVCNEEKAFRKVLIHGDCWVNNILFKYSDTGEPIDLRFVDFQGTRIASPALELNYFLLGSLQRDIRVNHWDDLLREYCKCFESCATELGYKGSTITYEDLCKDIIRTASFGFLSALTITALVLTDPDDTPDMSTMTEEKLEQGDIDEWVGMYSSPAFREVFEELLPYFDKLGVFD